MTDDTTDRTIPKRGFDVRQAAKYCQFSVAALNAMRLQGGGPRYIRDGQRVHYLREDLDTWLAGRELTPASTVPTIPKRSYDTRDAAEYCGMSPSVLNHLRIEGGGPHYIRIGRRVRYLQEDLDAWLDTFPRFEHTSAEGNPFPGPEHIRRKAG